MAQKSFTSSPLPTTRLNARVAVAPKSENSSLKDFTRLPGSSRLQAKLPRRFAVHAHAIKVSIKPGIEPGEIIEEIMRSL